MPPFPPADSFFLSAIWTLFRYTWKMDTIERWSSPCQASEERSHGGAQWIVLLCAQAPR
jgi:hypothetical protein